jgi:hypothetical protein
MLSDDSRNREKLKISSFLLFGKRQLIYIYPYFVQDGMCRTITTQFERFVFSSDNH